MKIYVILILVLIICFDKPISCLTSLNGLPDFVEKCEQLCEDQVRESNLIRLKVQIKIMKRTKKFHQLKLIVVDQLASFVGANEIVNIFLIPN